MRRHLPLSRACAPDVPVGPDAFGGALMSTASGRAVVPNDEGFRWEEAILFVDVGN